MCDYDIGAFRGEDSDLLCVRVDIHGIKIQY